MKITKTQLRKIIKEELLKEVDFKRSDEKMTPAAAELGRWLAGRPDVADAVASALKHDDLFPKAADALMQAYEASQSNLDDYYIGVDDD
jgi:hypothetical protein